MAYAELAGLAGDHRPVHVDHVLARLRRVRPVTDPRARSGLLARPDDRRDDHPVRRRGRRSGQGDRPRLHAGPAGGGLHGDRGDRSAGLRRRPVLQAHPDRLHERPGPHDPRGPAPEALRILHRRRLVPRGAERLRRGVADGETVPAALAIGLAGLAIILVLGRVAPKAPGVLVAVVAAIAAVVLFDLGSDGVSLVGELPQGFPPFTLPDVRVRRSGVAGRRCARHHPGVAHRHDLYVIGLRRSHRPRGRRQPGDDRHRHRQPRRRAVPGLPGEHERVADRGGGACRGQEPAHGGDRGR